jgi:hypothetical protein
LWWAIQILFLSFEGIFAFELGKTAEIRIRRIQYTTIFNRKRSEVCIGDKIGSGLAIEEHALKNLPMAFCGINQPNTRLVDPTLYPSDCLFHGQWLYKDLSVCGYPYK